MKNSRFQSIDYDWTRLDDSDYTSETMYKTRTVTVEDFKKDTIVYMRPATL